MSWKEELKKLEDAKAWVDAVTLMQDVIEHNPTDVEACVCAIYLFHEILLERDYPDDIRPELKALLLHYFVQSQKIFSDNAEYQFFIGGILYPAEWFFGLNDAAKPLEERTAFKMQKKAYELERGNILFECVYRNALRDPKAIALAKQSLADPEKMSWLQSKGVPGQYVLEHLNQITKASYFSTMYVPPVE